MRDESRPHGRRSIRLPTWDYRLNGAYFVTICTSGRSCLFDDPHLRMIVEQVWRHITRRTRGCRGDEFVVMPNHVHSIIWLCTDSGGMELVMDASTAERPHRCDSGSLGAIVGTYKAASARRINTLRGTGGAPVWQRGYYERVIRDERELNAARLYIRDNPRKWAEDKHNPKNFARDFRALAGEALSRFERHGE
jgi:REP element-mobilizing transposase RayT